MNADEIRELFARHEVPLSKKDVWIVQGNPVVHHAALERLAGNLGIKFNDPVMVRVEREEAVVMVRGHLGNKTEWSFGEAAIGQNYKVSGKQAAYPFAMAEKRAKDRVIVKLAGMHGAYSDEEAEDFRDGRPTDNGDEPPAAPPIELPDMRRATAVIEHKPAAPVAPAPEQPANPVPHTQAQAVVADPAAAASNSEDVEQRTWAEVLAEIQGHLDGARTVDDVSDIRALYADEKEILSRSEREAFDYAFEQAENRVSKPVEPVSAPEASSGPAAAEETQAGDAEDWAAYESRITRLAKATHDQAGADGLRKVWKAGKDYRALMEQRKAVTREQRVALTAVVQDAIKRAEAPAADLTPATAPVSPGLTAITADAPEAVRACGERVFSALSAAPTKEKAFVIWSRSANEREQCGASTEVLDAWAKEYREIRKRLPEEG